MKKRKSLSNHIEIENRIDLSNKPIKVPQLALLHGSLENKHPVVLDDGKTVIFISDKTKELETKQRYFSRLKNKSKRLRSRISLV